MSKRVVGLLVAGGLLLSLAVVPLAMGLERVTAPGRVACGGTDVHLPARAAAQEPGASYQLLRDVARSTPEQAFRGSDCDLLLLPSSPMTADDLGSLAGVLGAEVRVVAARGYIQGDYTVMTLGLGFEAARPMNVQIEEQLALFRESSLEDLESLAAPDPGAPDLGDGQGNEPPIPGSDDGAPADASPGGFDASAYEARSREALADAQIFLSAIEQRQIVIHVIRLRPASPGALPEQAIGALAALGDLLPVPVDVWPFGTEPPVAPRKGG